MPTWGGATVFTTDPAGREFLGETTGEVDDARPGSGVAQQRGLVGPDRRGGDDAGARSPVRHRCLAQPEHVVQLDVAHAVELRGGDLGDAALRHFVGGLVDKYVEAAELVDRPLHEVRAVPLVAEVSGEGDAAASGLADQAQRLVPVVLLLGQVAGG